MAAVYFFLAADGRSFTPRFWITGRRCLRPASVFRGDLVHNSDFSFRLVVCVRYHQMVSTVYWEFWSEFLRWAFINFPPRRWSVTASQKKRMAVYLIAAFLHGVLNYSVILIAMHRLTNIQDEIITAVYVDAITAVVIWLLRCKTKEGTGQGPPVADTADISPVAAPQPPVSP